MCGGRSRRMGRDKALVDVGGRTLLDRALAALAPVSDEILLATGATPRYLERDLPVVLDRGADLGPLAGLEAALVAARHERAIVLAVDMPAIEPGLLEALAARAERDDCDALLLSGATGIEPLCGVYHTRLLPAVRAALDAGDRRMIDLFAHRLADGRAPRLDVLDAGDEGATRNVNTAADLDEARASASSGAVPARERASGRPSDREAAS